MFETNQRYMIFFPMHKVSLNTSLLTRSFFFRAERRGELKSKKKEQLKSVTLYYCIICKIYLKILVAEMILIFQKHRGTTDTNICFSLAQCSTVPQSLFIVKKRNFQQTFFYIIVVGIICSPVPAALTAVDTRVLTPSVDRESRAEWRAWSPKCFRSSRKLPRTPLSKKHMQNTPRYLNICV